MIYLQPQGRGGRGYIIYTRAPVHGRLYGKSGRWFYRFDGQELAVISAEDRQIWESAHDVPWGYAGASR